MYRKNTQIIYLSKNTSFKWQNQRSFLFQKFLNRILSHHSCTHLFKCARLYYVLWHCQLYIYSLSTSYHLCLHQNCNSIIAFLTSLLQHVFFSPAEPELSKFCTHILSHSTRSTKKYFYSTLVSTVIKHRIKYANSVFRLCRAVCWALKIAFLLLAALLCSLSPSMSPLMPSLLVFSVCVFGIIYTFRILCILPQPAARARVGHVRENVAGAH